MSDIPCQTRADTKSVEAPRGSVAPCSPLLTDCVQKEQLAQQFGVSQRTIERWVRLSSFRPRYVSDEKAFIICHPSKNT